MSIRFAVSTCLTAAAFAWGCGESAEVAPSAAAVTPVASLTPTAVPQRPQTPAAARRGVSVRTVGSAYGTILANGAGKAFYLFDKERMPRSECYGDCAKAWPPVLTKGRPVAGRGVRAGLLGTIGRRDGRRQVTYRGRPLYYYVADTPGRVLCHDVVEFGGRWLVIRPNGQPVD